MSTNSEANVSETLLRNDFEAALAAFDAAVEWDGTNLTDGRSRTGARRSSSMWTSWAEMWEDWGVCPARFPPASMRSHRGPRYAGLNHG